MDAYKVTEFIATQSCRRFSADKRNKWLIDKLNKHTILQVSKNDVDRIRKSLEKEKEMKEKDKQRFALILDLMEFDLKKEDGDVEYYCI